MAPKNDGHNAPGDGGDDSVADLTPPGAQPRADGPPTLENPPKPKRVTIQLPPTVKADPSTLTQTSPPKAQTPTGEAGQHGFGRYSAGPRLSGTTPVRNDLSKERLLRDATPMDWEGSSCPSLGKIPLLAKLGQGGMGTVYYGVHPRLKSEVAVKVLPFHLADQNSTLVDRFIREAQIAAQVRSPHLVHVIDVNEESGLWYLVMEYVCGATAGKHLQNLVNSGQAGYSEVSALEVCLAACIGLLAAHRMNIIHRDVKPENIMIPYGATPQDLDFRNSKLMDLGLARVQTGSGGYTGLTAAESAMGTPGYMAPEQALDARTADQKSDVFSLGATIYALLTGKSPFHRDNAMKTIFATNNEDAPPLRSIRPDVSQQLSDIVAKCLQKNRDARIPDVESLMKELEKCRANASSQTPVITSISTGSKKASRAGARPLRAKSLVAAVVLIAAVGAGGAWSWHRSSLRNRHGEQMQDATRAVGTGDIQRAVAIMVLAHDIVESDSWLLSGERATLLDNEKSVQKLIDARKEERFAAKLREFDNLSAGEIKTEDAMDRIRYTFSELDQIKPANDAAAGELQMRQERLWEVMKPFKDEQVRQINENLQKLEKDTPDNALTLLPTLSDKLQANVYLRTSKSYDDLTQALQTLKDKMTAKKASDAQLAQMLSAIRAQLGQGDVPAARKITDDAGQKFPDNPEIAALREEISKREFEIKRKADIESHLKNAGELLDNKNLEKAEIEIREVEKLDSLNPKLAELYGKIDTLRNLAAKLANESEKGARFDDLQREANTALRESRFAEAESKITAMEQIFPQDETIPVLKRKVAAGKEKQQKRAKFDGLLTAADTLLSEPGHAKDAGLKLADAKALYPEDEAPAKRMQKLIERQEEEKLMAELAGLFDAARQSLDKGDLAAADATLGKAQAIAPKNETLAELSGKLTDLKKQNIEKEIERSKRSEFDLRITAAEGFLKEGKLDDAEQRIQAAEQIIPGDPALAKPRNELSAKRAQRATQSRGAPEPARPAPERRFQPVGESIPDS